jgi:hypothetical protein
VSGEVRWIDDGRFGVAFDEAVELERLAAQRQARTGTTG